MDLLDEKYPRVAARVRQHLETGWEPTLALLQQAMEQGVIRTVSLPVLQRMIAASIESFLADRTLEQQGIPYARALDEMMGIPSTDSGTVSGSVDPAPTVCGMVQKLDAINSPIVYVFLSSNFLHKNL